MADEGCGPGYLSDSADSSEGGSVCSPPKRPLLRPRAGPGRGVAATPRRPTSKSMHQAGCIVPAGQRTNLLQKLHLRQLYGSMRAGSRAEEQKVFSRLPGRLAFFIRDVVPHSALTAGHVFLGFSRCGQFLISYTQTSTENDQFDLNFNYYYRLHWWLFTPYSKARKIAEVTLFTDSGVYGNLRISVCQWPGDLTKLLVYGSQQSGECSDPGQSGSLHCYLTVTAVPR